MDCNAFAMRTAAAAVSLVSLGLLAIVYRLRRANLVLVEREAFLRRVLDSLPVALFCKDSFNDFRIVVWNRRAEEMWGISPAQALGQNDYKFFPKEQADFFRLKDRETLASGRIERIPEEPIDSKTHGRQYLRTYKVPIENAQGQAQFLLGISEDITEQRRQGLVIEDQRAKIIATAKLSALGEMAGNIAHEINNPLTIVHGKASQLVHLAQSDRLDAEQATALAGSIERHCMRIARIVSSLRSLSREGNQDPFAPVPVGQILDEVWELCQHRFAQNGVRLERVGEVPGTLDCRGTEIGQVLLNLINNAFDATQGLAERWVKIEIAYRDGGIEFAVTDSGSGIPAELREKIMQPLFTTKEAGKGTGLGLSISSRIVEDHGGRLWIDEASVHTRFVVSLPRRHDSTP